MKKKHKDLFINLLLACAPILLIILIEMTLRAMDYGYPNKLFIVEDIQKGKPFYYLNARLKEKHQFTREFTAFDPIFPAQMKFIKEKEDYRIFCMGGSTTQGYPYFHNGSFPAFLEGMLNLAQKKKHVEVINLGVTAMNSFGVLDFMRMAPEYDPDLIILYTGHNEFFGALGSASNLFLGHNRRIVFFFLKLQEFKIYLLARNIVTHLKKAGKKPKSPASTLMKKIVRLSTISVKSPLREHTVKNFQENLSDILAIARAHDIPVIIATVASNQKDFRPFDSEKFPDGSPQKEWEQYRENGRNALSKQDFAKAETYFRKALKLFPEHAQTHFDLGQTLLQTGQKDKAKKEMQTAKEKDIIPFRAPLAINTIIRQTTREHKAFLVDIEQLIENETTDRIPGKPFFIEHLHPAFPGNYKIASYLAEAVFSHGFLKKDRDLIWSQPEQIQDVKDYAGFTGLDMFVADYRVRSLISEWPFNINNRNFQPPRLELDMGEAKLSSSSLERIDLRQLARMHQNIGRLFFQKGDFQRSFREFQAASKLDIFNDSVFLDKAYSLLKLSRVNEAEIAVEKCLDLNPNNAEAGKLKSQIDRTVSSEQ